MKKVRGHNKNLQSGNAKKNKNNGHSKHANKIKFSRPSQSSTLSRPQKKFINDDDCPIHGRSHIWDQCNQNQYGSNFKPQQSGSIKGSTKSTQAHHYRMQGQYANAPLLKVLVFQD